jgi:enoyl-CoA hydratase/carnithine racemase
MGKSEYSFETVLIDIDNGVATMTLNRPEVLNALNGALIREWGEAMAQLDADDDVRVIVVTGAGRGFCAGLDRTLLMQTAQASNDAQSPNGDEASTGFGDFDVEAGVNALAFWKMRTPIIGAINGPAAGLGLSLGLTTDIRIFAEEAKLRFPFNRLGVLPERVTWLLPRLVGVERAFELLFTARYFTGKEAAEMGMGLRAVPADQVLSEAQGLAHQIVEGAAPAAIALTKVMAYRFLEEPDRTYAGIRELKLIGWLMENVPDTFTGAMAIFAGGEANWQGSKNVEVPEDILGFIEDRLKVPATTSND